jgi:phage tail P2-like protein
VNTLLPPNASALERAVEDVLGTRLENRSVPLRSLWAPGQAPAAWLPAQAWGLSVDEWDKRWSAGRKRDVIAAAIAVHRRKGSIGAVRAALTAAGYPDAQITEGVPAWVYGDGSLYGPALTYGYGGGWAFYRVRLARPISADQAQSVRRILRDVAPARCHLYALEYAVAPWLYGDGTTYGAATTYYGAGDY